MVDSDGLPVVARKGERGEEYPACRVHVETGILLQPMTDVSLRAPGYGREPRHPPTIDLEGAKIMATVAVGEITEDNGVIFLGQDRAWLVRDRANGVAIDGKSGRVLMTLDGRELTAHQRISEMADPLHFGTFGGLATKVIWFLFGTILTGMSVTGTIIYARRLAKSDKLETSTARVAWSGMGAWG